MQSRQPVTIVGALAASLAAATLYGCTSVNPAPVNNDEPAPPAPWITQEGGLCEGVDLETIPARPESDDDPNARWIDHFEGQLKFVATTDGQVQQLAGTEPEMLEGKNRWGDLSNHGLHLSAKIADNGIIDADHWGINWQAESATAAAPNRKYEDWSEYDGIVMWVRRGDKSAKARFMVQFPTPWSSPTEAGGDNSCLNDKLPAGSDAGTGVNGKCYAHMTYQGTALDCWRPVKIVFTGSEANLAPAFSPGPKGFDRAHVYGTEIAFSSSSQGNYATFYPADIWVDDIYLYKNK